MSQWGVEWLYSCQTLYQTRISRKFTTVSRKLLRLGWLSVSIQHLSEEWPPFWIHEDIAPLGPIREQMLAENRPIKAERKLLSDFERVGGTVCNSARAHCQLYL